MSNKRKIDIPDNVDKALVKCLDYAEQGVIIPLQTLLDKFGNAEDSGKILAQYPFIQRVQIKAANLANKSNDREAISKSRILTISSVVIALTFLLIVISICWLSINNQQIPSTLNTLASMLVGYIGGIVTSVFGFRIGASKRAKNPDS